MRLQALMKQRMVAVFLLGALLLLSPIVTLIDPQQLWLGIPALYLYLFSIWALLIALLAWIVEQRKR